MPRRRLSAPPISAAGLVIALAIAALPAASPPAWPPISAEDAAMKDCPKQPGAPAVILYREEITSADLGTMTAFKRLKILTPAGRDRSTIEIPFVAGYFKVTGIEARVVPPQGPEQPFTGQVFEKTALRGRRLRLAVKTFALPNVEVGSIIDYRYKLERVRSGLTDERLNAMINDFMGRRDRPEEGGAIEAKNPRTIKVGRWQVQEELFTKHLKLSYTNLSAGIASLLGHGGQLAWASVGMKLGKPFITFAGADLDMYNVPAFAPEDYMIPEDIARMSIDLFFLDGKIAGGADFWKLESIDWRKNIEKFIGRPSQLAAVAGGIVGDATEPEEQLRRIYARVQGFRNLSYERDLTEEQRKERKIKDNRRVEDVLENKYGLRSDITRTFVKLAQAAGFEAEVARVTARDDKLFRKGYLSFYDQLDSEMALVKVGDRTLTLDPATPFCPYGLIHWSRTNSTGLRSSGEPPSFFVTPPSPPDMAMTRREAALTLDPQGNLAGPVKITYSGQEALVRRLDHIDDDEAAWKTSLEKEFAGILPTGATATLTKVENPGGSDPDLIANFEVTIPGVATPAGEKMLLPVFPWNGAGQYPFRQSERQYPICFPYPFREVDDIIITLPEGLAAEVRPEARDDQDDFSAYTLACAEGGPGKLRVKRDLTLKKNSFPVEQYAAVKSFFNRARAGDEAQVVLASIRKAGNSSLPIPRRVSRSATFRQALRLPAKRRVSATSVSMICATQQPPT